MLENQNAGRSDQRRRTGHRVQHLLRRLLVRRIEQRDVENTERVESRADDSTAVRDAAAREVGGKGRTATITGTVGGNGWLTANIKGPKIDCQNINVPWFSPPPPTGG